MEHKELLRKRVEELATIVDGEVQEILGELVLTIKGDRVVETLAAIKNFPDVPCDFLHNLTAVDLSDSMEVVYQLTCLRGPQRMRVKAVIDRDHPVVDSVTGLWKGADFLEREVYDMFGVQFKGHPNLKRIYMWEGFEGHPLRKDYVPESREQRRILRPLSADE